MTGQDAAFLTALFRAIFRAYCTYGGGRHRDECTPLFVRSEEAQNFLSALDERYGQQRLPLSLAETERVARELRSRMLQCAQVGRFAEASIIEAELRRLYGSEKDGAA